MKTTWMSFIGLALGFALVPIAHADLVSSCNSAGDLSVMSLQTLGYLQFPTSVLQTGTADDVSTAIQNYCAGPGECLSLAPWILLSSSRPEVRGGALEIQELLAQNYLSSIGQGTVTEVLASAASAPAQYSPQTIAAVQQVIANARAASQDVTVVNPGLENKYTSLACLTYLNIGCTSAVKDLLPLGQIGLVGNYSAALTAMDATQTLFSDPTYSQGLALAAQVILQRVADAKAGLLPTTHLLDDLIAGFQKAGFSEADSSEKAFTFLGFYGARGASVDITASLAQWENYPVMVSTYIISAALGVLDSYTVSSGHPYSLPKNISSTCSYGREYHFWLSAYFAHELVKMNHSKEDAIIATHIFGVGYEAAAATITRTPWISLTVPANDPSLVPIRLNIAEDDAGSQFGAGNVSENIKLDKRLNLLLSVESGLEPLTDTAAADLFADHFLKYLLRWESVFQPDDGLPEFGG